MTSQNQNPLNNSEWIFDKPGFLISVSLSNQKFFLKAINNATGAQFGPEHVFRGITSGFVAECLAKDLEISEVTDNSIQIQTKLFEEPLLIPLCEISPLEEEVKELENQMKALRSEMQTVIQQNSIFRSEIESMKDQMRKQEGELNQLKLKPGKTHYFETKVEDWKPHGKFGLRLKTDFSHLNLENKPHVQVSLHGASQIWEVSGSNSIYNLTPQSFEIYIKFTTDGKRLDRRIAEKYGWYLSYKVDSLDDGQVNE